MQLQPINKTWAAVAKLFHPSLSWKAPARGVPADVMRVRQGSGVAQASGPNPMSFPGVNSC